MFRHGEADDVRVAFFLPADADIVRVDMKLIICVRRDEIIAEFHRFPGGIGGLCAFEKLFLSVIIHMIDRFSAAEEQQAEHAY